MYLRIENNSFGFVDDQIHAILETDIEITDLDYNNFFKEQSQGKQFRLKAEQPETGGLFDRIETFTPEPIEAPPSEADVLKEQVALLDGALNEVLFTILPEMQGGEI